MGIDPIGARPSPFPIAAENPAAPGTAAFAAQQEELATQQLQQTGGGGGGHGGGHGGVKRSTSAIEDIAARASLAIERRKTPAERQAEIERLKKLAEEQAQQVHERGEGEAGEDPQDRRQDDDS
jgi:hypothetical protein